jgi:alkaline phosphatase
MTKPNALAILRFALLIILLFFTAHSATAQLPYPAMVDKLPSGIKGSVKNIIFLIGDGMSTTTISVTRLKATGVSGMLQMDRMPIAGFVRTHSADKLITDSAAASTAMATGYKTNNGMLGLNPQGDTLVTIMEECQLHGKATGLVVTSAITHATPAGFASHIPSRNSQAGIAEQLLQHRVNVLLGGGAVYFGPKSQAGSKRKDERDLLQEAKAEGYSVCLSREELLTANHPYILGLFAADGMATEPPEPSLAEMTEKAISVLRKNEKGFFLMVEGSQIDWANHQNNFDKAVKQTLDFDQAIGVALAFAQQSRETLVVVTADHETGALIITGGTMDGSHVDYSWGSSEHNPTTVPLYAYGPGAENFSGFQENTSLPVTMARLLKLKDFPRIIKKSAAKRIAE